MAKRTTPAPGPADAVQPEPPAGSAMTEPAPAPTAPAPAEAAPTEPAVVVSDVAAAPVATAAPAETPAGPATGDESGQADAGAAAAPAGTWPDVSSPPSGPRCPWCSAALPSDDLATCPSCGAQLNGPVEGDVPGVTTIDVNALAWKAGAPPRRNKIMSWISGDADEEVDTSSASSAAVEPPSLAVRREMLRLELEAEGITLPHDAEPTEAEESAAEASPIDAGPAAEAAEAAEAAPGTPDVVAGSPDAGTGAPGG